MKRVKQKMYPDQSDPDAQDNANAKQPTYVYTYVGRLRLRMYCFYERQA